MSRFQLFIASQDTAFTISEYESRRLCHLGGCKWVLHEFDDTDYKKVFRKIVKKELLSSVARLEQKYADRSSGAELGDESYGYKDAASAFSFWTGCEYESAENYFYLIEAIAEWHSWCLPLKGIKQALIQNGIGSGRPQCHIRLP